MSTLLAVEIHTLRPNLPVFLGSLPWELLIAALDERSAAISARARKDSSKQYPRKTLFYVLDSYV